MKQRTFLILIILNVVLTIVGCSSNDSSTTYGQLALSIADAPVNTTKHVYVTLDKVDVHNIETGWETINEFDGETDGKLQVDLLQLRFDEKLLGKKSLTTGTYDKIRLYVATTNQKIETEQQKNNYSYVVYNDNTIQNLVIPSGEQTGLKINHKFTIEEGVLTELVLDNDVSEILKNTGNKNEIILSSTAIKVIDKVISGDIEGRILKEDDTAITDHDVIINALNSNNEIVASTIATTITTNEDEKREAGSFKIRGLEVGEYKIQAYVLDDSGTKLYQTDNTISITVSAEETNKTLIDTPLILTKPTPAE